VLALRRGLAEGLIAIHSAGAHPPDLKPSNVLLARNGPHLDFGILLLRGQGLADRQPVFMIGSPGFWSPEQAEGLTVGSVASDLFSLALACSATPRGARGPFGSGDTAALR